MMVFVHVGTINTNKAESWRSIKSLFLSFYSVVTQFFVVLTHFTRSGTLWWFGNMVCRMQVKLLTWQVKIESHLSTTSVRQKNQQSNSNTFSFKQRIFLASSDISYQFWRPLLEILKSYLVVIVTSFLAVYIVISHFGIVLNRFNIILGAFDIFSGLFDMNFGRHRFHEYQW